ncbi:MAG: RHS repeat-associated core domain-containing protein [Verrucomicrobiaceae bacterium]|nr:RHS repeat-associated core domain-containing protein [Verrucomicrobiaceae bacterium]
MLVRLRTDSGRTLIWERAEDGKLLSVVEQVTTSKPGQKPTTAPGTVGLKVARDPATGLVTGFEVNTPFGVRSTTLGYDAQKRLSSVTLPDSSNETYGYSEDAERNSVISITSRDLVQRTLSWNPSTKRLVSDGIWSYKYEVVGKAIRTIRTGPAGEIESYFDDSQNTGRVEFVSAEGTTTIRQKLTAGPAKGKVDSITRLYAGNPDPVVTYRAGYDDKGNLTEETDALSHKTTHAYVLWGNSVHTGIKTHFRTDATGAKAVEEYDRKGNLVTSTDALGHKTQYVYDNRNRRTQSVGSGGVVMETLTYTKTGRLESRTDSLGNKTTYGYDQEGNRTTTMDALGNVTKDEFDTRGNRIKTTNALGHTWTFEYDRGNRLVRTLAPDGHETEKRTYNLQGRLATVTDAEGNTNRTEYDAFGRVTSRTDALDRTTHYSYEVKHGATGCSACNASSMPTLVTLPSGRQIARHYDPDKHLIEETIAFGTPQAATTRHTYDAAGNLIKTTDPLGRATQFQYDVAGRRTSMIFPDQAKRSYAYDAAGQLIAETDELGHLTKRSYDAWGNLLTTTDPSGNTTTQLFETPASAALHRPTGTQSAAGVINRAEYDTAGRRITQIVGADKPSLSPVLSVAPSITRHTFDAVGNEIETTDPTGKVTKHAFDARNRRVSTTDALGRVWRYGYASNAGASGNPPCCGADPTANARAQTTTFPDGTTETRVTDAAGQLIETKDAKGDSVKYGYDPDGRLITLTDARNNVTRWTYDPRGKLESKVYPDKTLELYEHDAAGQLVSKTRPDGTAAIHTYDLRGRLLTVRWKNNKSEPIDYTYDAAGHLLTAKNDSATIERAYTPNGKIESETQNISAQLAEPKQPVSSYKVSYDYDPDGRLAAITYPEGTQIGYRYSNRGELAQVTERSADGPVRSDNQGQAKSQPQPGTANPEPRTLATYTRRPNGQVAELLHANGVKTVKIYDAAGRLEKISHLSPGGTELFSETSRYDNRDRRTARLKGDGTADLFAYDPAGQVIAAAYQQAFDQSKPLQLLVNPNAAPKVSSNQDQASSIQPQQTFAYDPAGNRKEHQDIDGTKTSYQSNEANQYTQLATPSASIVVEPDYDKNGNLLKDTKNTYTWDADIHLLSVETKSDDQKQASKITKFRYDPLHRRVARLESDGTLTHFVHDGWNVIAEYRAQPPQSSSPILSLTLIWGEDLSRTLQGAGGIGGLLLTRRQQLSSAPKTTDKTSASLTPKSSSPLLGDAKVGPPSDWFAYDSNGNVILLTNAGAETTARYSYDAFGKTLSSVGSGAYLNPYRFSTKPIELDSGLAFYGFRYYSPELGRWPSRDPSDFFGGINIYAFTTNRGVTTIDFMGLKDCSDPCGEFLSNSPINDPAGMITYAVVVCCNGQKYACIAKSGGSAGPDGNAQAVAIINECMIEHEKDHFDDISCPDDGGCANRPEFDDRSDRNIAAQECHAFRIHEQCLRAKANRCNGDAQCQAALAKEITGIIDRGDTYCELASRL